MMMMTSIKDRLAHNRQSPFPTKDKVLSYTIPIDSENLLLCSSSNNSSSSSSSNGSGQDNGSLNFITTDEDPCNGRDSLASFLDEGLGTSLDGVDEISSPIFSALGRNDSGVFSSDEGTGVSATRIIGQSQSAKNNDTHIHTNLIPPPISPNSNSSSSSRPGSSNNSIPATEAVAWKSCSSSGCGGSGSKKKVGATTTGASKANILLSPPVPTTTISVVADSVTGIPSIICTANPTTGSNESTSKNVNASKLQAVSKGGGSASGSEGTGKTKDHHKNKSMPCRQGPQKCTICDKVFSNASALTKHKLTHSDERRHACATCGKAFKRQDHLNGHMLTHRNKKPFECKSKGCGKSYCDARSLRRHVENRHGHEVLESLNLTSHKQSGRNSSNHNLQKDPQPEPQPELAQFKVELVESNNNTEDQKMLDCMPVLQPEPQLENSANNSEKIKIHLPLGPPVLQKVNENMPIPTTPTPPSARIPVAVKRENVSVFDFDESMEDSNLPLPINASFCASNLVEAASQISQASVAVAKQVPCLEKSSASPPQAIKVGSIQGAFSDMRLIQELAKRFSDSKVALFLASSGSIQLDGQSANTLSMSGASHAILPSNETGLFSVTPISIVPTSSGEFTFKPATISMSASPSEFQSPKPLYIVPSEPLLSTTVSNNNPNVPQLTPTLSIPPPAPLSRNEVVFSMQPNKVKEPKSKGEQIKEKSKSGIGASLANRIKSKLKAGSLKRLGKGGESAKLANDSSPKLSHQSPANTVVSSPADDISCSQQVMASSVPNLNGVMQTIQITAPGGGGTIATWCESPKDCAMNGLDEDRLSESGIDGDDKPVECSICCRRFKNTPALNGHMRLHGGYFKKETEGTKKKEVTKENTHNTPLQTASVSVRALIEEKIKERRNNLLKLAAAEKAATESGTSSTSETLSNQNQPKSGQKVTDKKSVESNNNNNNNNMPELSSGSSTVLAQQQIAPPPPKIRMENVKLKAETLPTCSEKDKICDQSTTKNSFNNTNISVMVNNANNEISNNIMVNNNNSPPTSIPTTAAIGGMEPAFQDLSILIGDGGIVGLGIGGNQGGGGGVMQTDLFTPTSRDPLLNQNQFRPPITTTSMGVGGGGNALLPFQMDKSNFTILDCGLNPEELCQAFHLVYVDNLGGNGGTDLSLLGGDQDITGKVKLQDEPLPEISSLTSDSQNCQMKSFSESFVICPPSQESCNLSWEWRDSTSSDTTENGSLSTVQDNCVGSFLCSSASGTPDETFTKDPVTGGGYCYTPILSPNSFCLTPGPDSPFETGAPNQSLSFICPSPSIGSSSVFSDPSVASLINPPSSVEPIFSPDQPPPLPQPSNIIPTASELQKYPSLQQQQQQLGQTDINTLFVNGLESFNRNQDQIQGKQGFINVGQLPMQQSPNLISLNGGEVGCLPAFSTIPTAMSVESALNSNLGNVTYPKDIVVHYPMSGLQSSEVVPFEVFAACPLPPKISEKWINGSNDKNGKTMVGSEFQAEIPAFRGNKARLKSYKTAEEKLWDPNVLDKCSYEEVDKYLEFACCSAVPGGGWNKEYALHLLMLSKGNIREALLRLMEKLPSLPAKLRNYPYSENQRWTPDEIMTFQISLVQFGKNFARISKAIGTKKEKECVSFYYFWKKVCPSEYQVMKQIWKDRLDHQQSSSSSSH